MKDFSVEYDEKTPAVTVDHGNILKDLAKEFDKSLIIKPFQVAVQIAFESNAGISKPETVEKAADSAAEELAQKVRDEIYDLQHKLEKRQKEETAGNKKAAAEGDKEVKATKKKLDKLADEFGGNIRTAVEDALKSQSGGKVKARSTSRTVARGLELQDNFFKEKAEGEESSPYFGKLAKSLAVSGKELSKLTVEEKNMRRDLAQQIGTLQQTVDKQRGNNSNFDIRDFAKNNPKDARSLETSTAKYVEFVGGMKEKLEAASKTLTDFQKLVDHAENMDDRKTIEKESADYEKALGIVNGTMKDKLDAGQAAQRLFKDDYGDGKGWKDLIATLGAIKAAAKSGATLQTSGAELDKAAKG